VTPNPSIERTSNGWLRHPLAAAHVKRYAPYQARGGAE